MIAVTASTIEELVQALDPALLPELLLATAVELEETGGGWVERAAEELNAGADEFQSVLEQSEQFTHLATVVKIAAAVLRDYSREIGAFD